MQSEGIPNGDPRLRAHWKQAGITDDRQLMLFMLMYADLGLTLEKLTPLFQPSATSQITLVADIMRDALDVYQALGQLLYPGEDELEGYYISPEIKDV